MSDVSDRESWPASRAPLRRMVERERAAGGGELLAVERWRASARRGAAAIAPAAGAVAAAATRRGAATTPPASRPPLRRTDPRVEPPVARTPRRRRRALPTIGAPLVPDADRRAAAPRSTPSRAAGARRRSRPRSRACRKCGLCETRTQAVPGVGPRAAASCSWARRRAPTRTRWASRSWAAPASCSTRIDRGDGREPADSRRERSSRETVYIGNVLKCRPPENRNPLPHEIEQCSPYLMPPARGVAAAHHLLPRQVRRRAAAGREGRASAACAARPIAGGAPS